MKALVIVEVLLCFGPATLLLLLGVTVAPMQVYYLFTAPRAALPGALYVIGWVVAGFVGLGALAYVLRHLFADTPIKRPIVVFAALLVALAALVPYAIYSDTVAIRLMTVFPFAGAAHILYLSRRLFVKPSRTSTPTGN
jgi:hypothetical protein